VCVYTFQCYERQNCDQIVLFHVNFSKKIKVVRQVFKNQTYLPEISWWR